MTCYTSQLTLAEEAARKAGALLRERFHSPLAVDAEMAHDIKLQLDREAQQLIVECLRSVYPDYAVLGEEGCADGAADAPCWIIDPIDGTVNYFYGIPIFCVSIALQVQGKLVLGCVYDPMQNECFTALAGGRAYLNGRPVSVSVRDQMAQAVLFAGHGTHDGSGEKGVRRFAYLSAQVKKMRILGSAALTLCYIASGRFDAYIEDKINLWDFAAARVILEAAGGCLEFTAQHPRSVSGALIAWNGRLPIHAVLQRFSEPS